MFIYEEAIERPEFYEEIKDRVPFMPTFNLEEEGIFVRNNKIIGR